MIDKTTALDIVKQVCAQFRGTLEEHTTIQDAIKVLENISNDKAVEAKPSAEAIE